MKRRDALGLAGVTLLGALGCAPLTFSNDGAVDFERYRSVRVEPVAAADSQYATEYLARELVHLSGFSRVTTSAREPVDLVLRVEVTVTEVISFDEHGHVDRSYLGKAVFRARTPEGLSVDSGVVEDQSEWPTEVVEDVLDLVAHRYLAPYRV